MRIKMPLLMILSEIPGCKGIAMRLMCKHMIKLVEKSTHPDAKRLATYAKNALNAKTADEYLYWHEQIDDMLPQKPTPSEHVH